MTEVPFFETIHTFNVTLGDIASSPNSMDRMAPALDAGLKALQARNQSLRQLQTDGTDR